MIVFRHADHRFPFLWEDNTQPPARWHGPGEGPAQYFADTTYGAWAEFVRHEGLATVDEVEEVTRVLWAVELPDPPTSEPELNESVLRGGLTSYARCQQEARRLRARGATGMKAPSAALLPGQAAGFVTSGGSLHVAPPREGVVYVVFGTKPLVGWRASEGGIPAHDVLKRVNPL